LLVGPSGGVLSLDAALGRGDPRPSVRANIALRLLQVHLCVVYLFSGCGKLLGASWWEGTALWGAIANEQYRTLDLTGLARHPLVSTPSRLPPCGGRWGMPPSSGPGSRGRRFWRWLCPSTWESAWRWA
ncbi:MAG: hypothetical protein ACKOBP_11450, partial [Planctomycetia bacterium]